MSTFERLFNIYRREGFFCLVFRVLRFLRFRYVSPRLRKIEPYIPRRTAKYNGVRVPAATTVDSRLPWTTAGVNRPHYEYELVTSLDKHVNPGDDVVIVGGGWGVTTTVAARAVGEDGSVTVYEGSEQNVQFVRETARINDISDRVSVTHAIVGRAISLRGEAGEARIVKPNMLPQCDVLELDCEGAEIDILESLSVRPRVLLVESHGLHDAPPERIHELIIENGYEVVSREPEIESDGIEVFTALNTT